MRAAIDVNRLAGDEPAILADQEQAGGGDLVDGALPAERDADGVRQAAVIPRTSPLSLSAERSWVRTRLAAGGKWIRTLGPP
jgi:hypothetical protein